jgi:hypothetical protein
MESSMIPSAIQRIRSFLIEMSGMKVKPWATTEESLAALHTTLVARHQCQIFWRSLRVLLANLAKDLKTRQAASPGTLLDNELLDGERYAALLDEIRAALASQAAEASTFRRLAGALSAPALGLLLLLAGAATVGCEQSALHTKTPDGAVQVASMPDAAGPAPSPAAPDAAAPSTSDASRSSPDGQIYIVLPDLAPRKDLPPVAYAPMALDAGMVTLQDIMAACNIPEASAVVSCLSVMRTSWTTGMAQVLAGQRCDDVRTDLTCFVMNQCVPSPKEFDPATAFYCPPVIIYMGVRFV